MPRTSSEDDEEFLDTIAAMGEAAQAGDTDKLAELDVKATRKGWK